MAGLAILRPFARHDLGDESTVRAEFVKRFSNSAVVSLASSVLAVVLGSLAAYGLSRFSYKFAWMRNADISFLLPVAADPAARRAGPADPGSLQGAGPAGHADRVDPALHAVGAADRHLDHAGPVFVDPDRAGEAALVDGLSIWGAFLTIILPIALPGMVAAFILSLVLTWNEYFFAALLTSTHANTLPVMVASQTGSQGISWWSMAALSWAAILPLIVIGVVLESATSSREWLRGR
jgi:multiple sugar transport system permease protein